MATSQAAKGQQAPNEARTDRSARVRPDASGACSAYAPEHNPDEDLNNDLKQTLRQKPQPGSKAELLKSTRSVLEALQSMPERIRSYFALPPAKHAA